MNRADALVRQLNSIPERGQIKYEDSGWGITSFALDSVFLS